ncbi:hypothetical protein HL658_23195 [Azospirillum sp. RWY-5-1]|uniref:DUF6455 domain-containing protein n=1 Tax=Azospirillum oleiclasticum TaxID=2735135 RepID=A0ABX2TH42_9PROT|nr:DUF6455 family protein [Azospirillum oleiclasticum]NYZ15455.1 hypothetical protein [Azospirillum oleiclasticum]NYZ22478.1 hypothetical protein [Azospirillum oleiclasticum]
MDPVFALIASSALLAAGLALAVTRRPQPLPLATIVARRRPGPRSLEDTGILAEMADAVGRCRACPRTDACHRWLAAGSDEACPGFCPNRSVVERIE